MKKHGAFAELYNAEIVLWKTIIEAVEEALETIFGLVLVILRWMKV